MNGNKEATRTSPSLARGLRVQGNVIGALLMRELHTRYGRDNVGYLWVILEPMILAAAVALIHAGADTHFTSDIRPVPFAIVGYCTFMIFRGIFGRAEAALESNLPLLYHRQVTVFDILFSRALLEAAGAGCSLVILLLLTNALGLGNLPARPLYMMIGVVLILWFAFGLSMIVCVVTHENRTAGRLVHPISYILFPLSGALYQLEWIPEPYRSWLAWFPMPHIFEIVRYGQFEGANLDYARPLFVVATCIVLTYVGLIALRMVRRHIHLH